MPVDAPDRLIPVPIEVPAELVKLTPGTEEEGRAFDVVFPVPTAAPAELVKLTPGTEEGATTNDELLEELTRVPDGVVTGKPSWLDREGRTGGTFPVPVDKGPPVPVVR